MYLQVHRRAAGVSRGAAFGDIDNDGDIDIAVANNSGPVRLLLNQAAGNHWLTVKLQGSRSNRDSGVAFPGDGWVYHSLGGLVNISSMSTLLKRLWRDSYK